MASTKECKQPAKLLRQPENNLACTINQLADLVAKESRISGVDENGRHLGASGWYASLRDKAGKYQIGRKEEISSFSRDYLNY